MLSFVATLITRNAHPKPQLRTSIGIDGHGRRELCVLAGGARLDDLEAAVRGALSRQDEPVDRVTIGILPRLTPNTAECRAWRMTLQRSLRAETGYGFALAVEYERWR